jgi:signal transduction histidine kinase
VAVAIAVLRYRLDGIDVVINRTLVYALLTAAVIAVYVLIVGYLGAALRRPDDLLISLVATGLVAVLFAPARDRLQRAVNHLMYGRRDEPYAALAHLGERLDATLAPDAVLPAIVSTVREALRLPYVALRVADEPNPVAVGELSTATETLPLLHHGAPIGELVLGLRPGENAFSPADRRLLADLARQAGVAVSTVALTADLQRSRERLVTTREEERRRLRRDLHDGLGPLLTGIGLNLDAARARAGHAADAGARGDLGPLLGQAKDATTQAIADLRGIVYGLRPSSLDDLGLAGAIAAHIRRLTEGTAVQITLEADPPPDLPAAVEVATFRIASRRSATWSATPAPGRAGSGWTPAAAGSWLSRSATTARVPGRGRPG